MAPSETTSTLDPIDRRMLAVLQAEGRITNAALAERLHLSPSPCLRRLRALEEDGVITGYHARLDRRRLGLDLTVFVELKIAEHSTRNAAAITEAIAAVPEVVSAHFVSGSADLLREVVAADLDDHQRLAFDILLPLPGVSDLRSNFALRTIKAGAPLPT